MRVTITADSFEELVEIAKDILAKTNESPKEAKAEPKEEKPKKKAKKEEPKEDEIDEQIFIKVRALLAEVNEASGGNLVKTWIKDLGYKRYTDIDKMEDIEKLQDMAKEYLEDA